MISRLRGTVTDIRPTEMIMDVHGVGYHLHIPFSTYEAVNVTSDEVILHVYTHVREDQIRLFGFATPEERKLFILLIQIAGVGPSMALSILSGITIGELIESVHLNKVDRLLKIPGIGKSKGEKLLFEMNRKIKQLESLSPGYIAPASAKTEAVEALTSLGFEEKKVIPIIDEILATQPTPGIELLVKTALKHLSS